MKEVQVYHGGYKFFCGSAYEPSNKKGRMEYGAGLYATPCYQYAKNYAKGSRSLYKLTVVLRDEGNIDNIKIPVQDGIDFLKSVKTNNRIRVEIAESINRRTTDDGLFSVTILINNMVNRGLIHKNAKALNQFVVEHGGDYSLDKSIEGQLICIYNLSIITNSIKTAEFEDFPKI